MLLTLIPRKVRLLTGDSANFFDLSVDLVARFVVYMTPGALVHLHLSILICQRVLIGRAIEACHAKGYLESIGATKLKVIGEVMVEWRLQYWNV